MRSVRVAAAALILVTIGTTAREARSVTGSLSVRAQVTASACTVGAAAIDFGSYESGQRADLQKEGSIAYSACPIGAMKVELGGGGSNSPTGRIMTGPGGAKLAYQLYGASNRKKIWGTGTNGLAVTVGATRAGSIPVYGTIPGSQSLATGAYTDTVVITVGF